MSAHTFELGAKARDRVSAWTGTITARYEYLNGCERYEISGTDKDGKPEAFVFDAQQVEVLEPPTPELTRQPAPVVATGGARDSRPVAR
jgi:hypothetical protein